jgi:hypothetical protein
LNATVRILISRIYDILDVTLVEFEVFVANLVNNIYVTHIYILSFFLLVIPTMFSILSSRWNWSMLPPVDSTLQKVLKSPVAFNRISQSALQAHLWRVREREENVEGGVSERHCISSGDKSFLALKVPRQCPNFLPVEVRLIEGEAPGSENGEELGCGICMSRGEI